LGLNDALGIPGPQVHTRSQHPLTIAIEELRQDKLEVSFRQPAEDTEEQVGAADADDFISPPDGVSQEVADVETDVDPTDEGAA
jgi:DNA-directed RNA polymerase subunit omega